MVKKKGGPLKTTILLVILIILLSFLGYLTYILYYNFPSSPQIPETIFKRPGLETGNLSYGITQFYNNMKFNHNDISYIIDDKCSKDRKEKMIEAFDELSSRVEVISFSLSTSSQPDINVTCSGASPQVKGNNFYIAGEGGAEEVIPTGAYNVITKGIIILNENPRNFYDCGWPNLELHELLHVFGFDHSTDEDSIMYPVLKSCSQKLDESIITHLKELYSLDNLPDLYFEDAKAIKNGRYLDFNVSIRNSGDVDSGKFILEVLDNGEKVDSFNLNSVPYGAGVNFQVMNVRLTSRSSSDITLVIDASNSIKEFDKENNIAELSFSAQ